MVSETELVRTVSGLGRDELRMWVDAGWVRPRYKSGRAVFSDVDVARVRLIVDMRDDLGLARDSIPVVLSLIDQLHGVRRELRRLAAAVESEPDEVRARICRAMAERRR